MDPFRMRSLTVAIVLFLTACGGGGPLPPPGPGPIPVPRPGSLLLTADWSTLSAAGTCGGSPFACHLPPDTQWGLQQQTDVAYLSVAGGQLIFRTDPSGMSMVNARTFDRTQVMSIEEVVTIGSLDCSTISYVGPVIYGGGVDDGDPTGRYRAEYVSCFPGNPRVQLWLYSPTWAGTMPGGPFDIAIGSTHALRIDWYPGDRVIYFLDGQPVFTETAAFGHDPLTVPTDPHPAMWFGAAGGDVIRFDAYGGP